MKSKVFWVLRHLIISAGFLWATEIPQGMIRLQNESLHHKPYQDYLNGVFARFTEKDFALLEVNPENYQTYTDSLKKNREVLAKHEQYTYFLYYRDLAQIRMFQIKFYDQLDSTDKGRSLLSDIEFGCINQLHNSNLKQNRSSVTDTEITKARDYWLHDAPRSDAPKFSWTIELLIPMFKWLTRIYLHGFPFALILFLIWKFNLKKDFYKRSYGETMQVKQAPISFGLSLLFWPLVLWIDIRNRWKRELERTEILSRRDSMLSVFSKQEEQLLELGKKMKISEFREHLDSIGMVRKHSFASALLVTLFLIIVPASLFSQTSSSPISKERIVTIKSDYGGGGVHHHVFVKGLAIIPTTETVSDFPTFQEIIFYITDFLYEFLFVPDIGKVPLVLNNFAMKLV